MSLGSTTEYHKARNAATSVKRKAKMLFELSLVDKIKSDKKFMHTSEV